MNRFDESPMFNTPSWDRDEDGYPCPEPTEVCEYCDATVFTLETAAWDDNLRVCESCAAGEPEPECECAMSGDSYDPRGCELHDQSSTWNARMSAIREDAAVERKPVVSSACPFCHSTRVGQSGPFSECGNCRQIWNPGLAKGKVA